jgi:hypothetical protein
MMLRRRMSLPGSAIAAPTSEAVRRIRTQIPPRPAVTVVTYLDHYGNPIKTKEETELSLIRTRDNKFFLQRVFEDESIVRFPAPGLGMIKNSTNFEYFSLNEIDIYGGVVIPVDVTMIPQTDRPMFFDAVHIMMRCEPTAKFTRKDRRAHNRKLYAHWEEDPEKYRFAGTQNALLAMIFASFVGLTYHRWTSIEDPLAPNDATTTRERNSFFTNARNWASRHPEHNTTFSASVDFTPAQLSYVQARTDSMDSAHDVNVANEWVWKIRHARTYGHWPKGIRE